MRIIFVLLLSFGIHAGKTAVLPLPKCGKLLNTSMKFDPMIFKASFLSFSFTDEEFCDLGTKELNANFDVVLYDKKSQVINKKSIFLNTLSVSESLNENAGTVKKNRVVLSPQFRNVKFSLLGNKAVISKYKIFSKANNQIYGEGDVN